MDTDLAALLGTHETPGLEFKESARDSAVLKAVCAFVNDLPRLGGGDLLIGVDDRGRPVPGVDTGDKTLLALTDLRDNGKILPRPSLVVAAGRYQGQPVVRIRVEASPTSIARLDGTAWVRPGPTTRRATADDERVLTERRHRAHGPFDVRPIDGLTADDLDLSLFSSTYLPALVAPEVLEDNGRPVAQQLIALGLAGTTGGITPLGILTVGLDPSAAVPGAYVQFVRYAGTDVSAPVADEQEVRENIIGGADRLASVLRGHLHTRVEPGDGFRDTDRPDYPFAALREICMNAVMHRNYETSYAPVRISWFDDRIEVTNPGGPFGQVRDDNFDRVNDYRNPNLAAAMKALGYVNRFGRGIGRMRAELARNGNPAPDFVVDDSSWVVAVRRAGA